MIYLISISIVISSVFLIPYLAKLMGYDFGSFSGWELGSIIQTIYTFKKFAEHNPPSFVSNKQMGRISRLIYGSIIVSICIYILFNILIAHKVIVFSNLPWYSWALVFLTTYSITIIPMLVYFISNLRLIYFIRRKAPAESRNAARDILFLKNTIRFLDLPCLIPYMMVLIFAFINRNLINYESYVAGAGSLLLVTSNLLSIALNKYLKRIDS